MVQSWNQLVLEMRLKITREVQEQQKKVKHSMNLLHFLEIGPKFCWLIFIITNYSAIAFL